ncbi:hypothetical protein [Quatrionicoccus australiensis]|nr:hypothetical protein [Quatrionicoccus australiensis]MCB4358591.1 hypothetical protein [Quatrionicoccus australiensis]
MARNHSAANGDMPDLSRMAGEDRSRSWKMMLKEYAVCEKGRAFGAASR